MRRELLIRTRPLSEEAQSGSTPFVLIAEEARWDFFVVDEDGLHLNYAPVY